MCDVWTRLQPLMKAASEMPKVTVSRAARFDPSQQQKRSSVRAVLEAPLTVLAPRATRTESLDSSLSAE